MTLAFLLSVSPGAATDDDSGACGPDGGMTVDLYGAIRASLDWRTDTLTCDGMPRPDGEGARLRISGPLVKGALPGQTRNLTIIITLPDLTMGRTGDELPTSITLIEEGAGRFFSNQDTRGCWTDVSRQVPLHDSGDTVYQVSGMLYCLSPLVELNGDASISFTELDFTGRLNWEESE